jgi:glyoxylase-like metal-dependent hydrolase (beta-lactamase superfamily II)/ferredoxin
MARAALRHQANAEGAWFVDSRCIDCGTCREIAPGTFTVAGGQSVVGHQPAPGDTEAELGAWLAAQACPTSSIGTLDHRPRPGRLYPREVEPGSGVHDVGYCSEDSFGASAWFVTHPEGNVLVDSPRFTEALAGPFAERGGIAHVLLTHRDDVADADRWAERFGARVWIHADDRGAAPYATDLLEGGPGEPTTIAPGVVAHPVPGHTRGSVVFVVDGRFCFSGDSLAWSHERGDLTAFRGACWYSWPEQTRSLRALAEQTSFEWLLPGHGARAHLDAAEAHRRLDALVDRMAAAS